MKPLGSAPATFRGFPLPSAMTRLALVFALLTATRLVAAQSPTSWRVEGRILDSASAPITGAAVTLIDAEGRESRGTSGADGKFSLAAIGRGRHTFTAGATGLRTVSRNIDLTTPATALGDIVLRPRAAQSPVVVIGRGDAGSTRHLAAADMLSAVSIMTAEQVARENVDFAQELLRKVPGVYHADFNQGIVSGDIAMRGFNTEGDVSHARIMVDGIPMLTNAGFGEINAIPALEIERMEVVRGTSDARYGLFNIAGNVNVTTKQGGNNILGRLTTGSFGTTEGQLVAATQRGGYSQTLAGSYRTTDGYRDNSELTKYTASGKWFYRTPSDRLSIGLIGRLHDLETDAPGYLTLAQSRATPTASPAFSESDGGDISTHQLSLHADVTPTTTTALTVRAYGQAFNRNRFVRFTAAGAQQERREDENQYGLISQFTWRPQALRAQDVVVSMGADWQTQDNLQQRFRTANRVRAAVLRDYDFTFSNRGGFAQLDVAPVSPLRVHAGVRVDGFDGEFTNKVTRATSPILDYGTVWQPKFGAIFTPRAGYSLYGNYGRSFQIGTGIGAYGTAPLRPSRNDGWEVGVSTAPTSRLTLRAGVWQQDASDEVRLKFDNSGDSENVGQTERKGIDVEGTFAIGGGVSAWGAFTSQRATLVEPGLTQPTLKGKRLNHVPDWTTKLGVDWSHRSGLAISAWTFGQDDYFLTPANTTAKFGSYFATNLDVSWRWRTATVGLAMQNVFDRYFEYAWFDGTQTLHSPANGRGVLLNITLQR